MKPRDVRKLVGGYAMGTLTGQERRALLEAALSDQELFHELAREQALKDLLEDPLARRQLLDAVEEKRDPAAGFTAWWKRPATWALAGGLVAAAMLVAIFVRPPAISPKPETVLMAKREASPEPPKQPARLEARKDLEAGKAKPEVAAVAVSGQAARPEAVPAPRQISADGLVARSSLAARSSPVPYKLLRADAAGDYVEVGPDTVFGKEDRVRVAFEPAASGHLRVVSRAPQTLLDMDLETGVTTNLDVPQGETRLIVTFTATGETSAAAFEIQIRRE